MNCLFLATVGGTLLTRLRLMRRELQHRSPNVQSYRALAAYAPTIGAWKETRETADGWDELLGAGLTKDTLKALWDNEELELQELTEAGEWEDVFKIEYPDRDPVPVD